MKDTIKLILDEHEKENPDHKKHQEIATEDLISLGKLYSGKPIVMHSAYQMDGNHDNKEKYRENYDHGLTDLDKREVDEEIIGLSEIVSMISDPRIVEDESDDSNLSENREIARDIMRHLKTKHHGKDYEKALEKELINPLLQMLQEHFNDKDTILEHHLSPTIVKDTEHNPKKYHDSLKRTFLTPVFDSHANGKYSKLLQKGYK